MKKTKKNLLEYAPYFSELVLKNKLDSVLFVCVQHILSSTIDLFEALIELGALPENIYVLGKHYSTISQAEEKLKKMKINVKSATKIYPIGFFNQAFESDVQQLWQHVESEIKNKKPRLIVILDDGGHCLNFAPNKLLSHYPIVGIEQTTGGLLHHNFRRLNFPIIEVASSAAKRKLESPFIAEAIASSTSSQLQLSSKNMCFGVIGKGAIGQAVIQKLRTQDFELFSFDITDENPKKMHHVFQNSDILLSCTGRDIFHNLTPLKLFKKDIILVSCSSEDKEFRTLLRNAKFSSQNLPLENLKTKNKSGGEIKILKGGFPINFNNQQELEPIEDIYLTRLLLLGGLIQAVQIAQNKDLHQKNCRLMFEPSFQKHIALNWLKIKEINLENEIFRTNFSNLDWIKSNSGGFNYTENFETNSILYERSITL